MGVVCVKINMHNTSIHVTFIEQTMPMFIHNMASYKAEYVIIHAQHVLYQHVCICSILSCMHNIPSSRHNILTCMQTWHMHTQHANMYVYTIYQLAICTCNMLLCMHAQYAFMHSIQLTLPQMCVSHAQCVRLEKSTLVPFPNPPIQSLPTPLAT